MKENNITITAESVKNRRQDELDAMVERVRAVNGVDIDYSDAPELPDEWFERALAAREERRTKRLIHIRIDPDIIEYFKNENAHYQSRINEVLRAYVETAKRRLARAE